jgi:cytochrome c nitrite reductase small subunit
MAGAATPLLGALIGIPLGLGLFTFHYAEGMSYFSTDPRACANCHIMQNELDSWQKSSHHTVAGCADCHLPPHGLAKLWAKSVNGYHHSRAFTFQDFHEPIVITERNAELLQENCLRCHGDLVHEIVAGSTTDRDAVRCVHCHRSAGHGDRVGLGGADRGPGEGRSE